MPWKERDVKNLRMEFVLRSFEEKLPFTALCSEYGIQPKTAHSKWGPRKIRELYGRRHPGLSLPSESSFKRVLGKAGLVKKRKRRRSRDGGRLQPRASSEQPNDVWTVDFKGWWYTPEGERCEPLTVRDDYSRYVLCAAVVENARSETVRVEFERLFDKHGLPRTIRSDNGTPFAATWALLGLSRLSVWWLALRIDLDRIDPGRPSQNGGHERMHRDIACELEHRVEEDPRQQAPALETWRRTFNEERPHEALGMRCPAELYRNSPRAYKGTPEQLIYPREYLQRKVHTSGEIRIEGTAVRLSKALAGWNVGLKTTGVSGYWVYFGQLCLGRLDLETESFLPITSVCKEETERK